ncbi:hypothetical protein [Streptomyces sp. NPDC048445]|uniref:hypothetical protein n=1 Tax=Streptomyces sp. NPDC048445 TaxID=3365553 RepID=UPI0037174A40
MLRIEFGTEDLNRLRLAESVQPLWETALSLQLLQNRHAALVFDPWRRKARADLDDEGLTGTTAALMRICPHAEYFPDFLTPRTGDTGLEAGLDAVLSTPRERLGQELGQLYPDRCMPASVRRLAEGNLAALHWLGEALRRFHSVAVAPYQDAIRAEVAADLPHRSQAALTSGAEGLLASYQSELIRRDGALECAYPIEWELTLDGRPLHLIPSFFCTRWPVTLADPKRIRCSSGSSPVYGRWCRRWPSGHTVHWRSATSSPTGPGQPVRTRCASAGTGSRRSSWP